MLKETNRKIRLDIVELVHYLNMNQEVLCMFRTEARDQPAEPEDKLCAPR